jgi:hypothetical protein
MMPKFMRFQFSMTHDAWEGNDVKKETDWFDVSYRFTAIGLGIFSANSHFGDGLSLPRALGWVFV